MSLASIIDDVYAKFYVEHHNHLASEIHWIVAQQFRRFPDAPAEVIAILLSFHRNLCVYRIGT